MRKLAITIVVLCITLAGLLFFLKESSNPVPASATATAQQTLPWQIELVDGRSRVFGLTLGQSRMADAVKKTGNDYELALLAKPGQAESLELYASNFKAGALRGSLIVVADVTVEDIARLRQQLAIKKDYLETGTIKTTLRFEQQQAALAYPIRSILFFPVASLDQGLVEERFGKPALVLPTAEQVSYYLYPPLGLSVMINADGKDMLQYVSPAAFAELQYGIQWQADTFANQR